MFSQLIFTGTETRKDKARYLLARLLVRKTGKWYRLSQLKYVSELGPDGMVDAMRELCGTLGSCDKSQLSEPSGVSCASSQSERALNFENLVDLVSDDEDKIILPMSIPSSTKSLKSSSVQSDPGAKTTKSEKKGLLEYYAEDESRASLPELLKCLTVEELKNLAKTLKLPNVLTTVRQNSHSFSS